MDKAKQKGYRWLSVPCSGIEKESLPWRGHPGAGM